MRTGARYPLHRSLVFWAGLLVIGFIVWSWRESEKSRSAAVMGEYELIASNSGVAVVHHGGYAEVTAYRHGFNPSRVGPMRMTQPGFLQWERYKFSKNLNGGVPTDAVLAGHAWFIDWAWAHKGGGWLCYVPHWLILLVAAVIWAALLGWRVRRWRRMALVTGVEMGKDGKA